jgi:hypothetical protein
VEAGAEAGRHGEAAQEQPVVLLVVPLVVGHDRRRRRLDIHHVALHANRLGELFLRQGCGAARSRRRSIDSALPTCRAAAGIVPARNVHCARRHGTVTRFRVNCLYFFLKKTIQKLLVS